MRRFTALLLGICLAATTAFGGGYQVGLHSMRNIGMGLIGTSLTYDASSYFYNPGAAAFVQDRFSISGGVSLLMARTTFQPKDVLGQYNIEHLLNTPLYFYFGFKPFEDLSIGFAVNTPYGNKLSWGDEWQGRYLIQNLSFKAITIQPSFSYKIKDVFSFGMGLVFAIGNVELNKALPIEGQTGVDGQVNIKGSTYNVGFNGGILIRPVKGLNIGVDYRSRINMVVDEADATFTVPTSMQSNFPDQKVSTSLPLPANLDFGISYEIKEKFMIGINLCYVFWNVYDTLIFDFKTKTAALNKSYAPAMYENKLIPRIGAQYKINDIVTVRLGGYYDPSPVPDDYLNPQTPSMNQIGLSAGLSVFPLKGFSIDAAFLYIMGLEREGTYSPENFSGSYRTNVYIPGIGLTYNF
ncbi:MAG: outer membrane protein transport protein [Bacteroidales bacterium]|nr:outer membrane protein transport protein [Bacteroidales bacterium]